jgi:DNA-binding transcriptional regulator YdaS (Cro superfamily)
MCELLGMGSIAAFRKDVLRISQEEFARRLGLSSKSHISEIERKDQCAPHVALEIERLSDGKIDAASISPAVAIVREHAA